MIVWAPAPPARLSARANTAAAQRAMQQPPGKRQKLGCLLRRESGKRPREVAGRFGVTRIKYGRRLDRNRKRRVALAKHLRDLGRNGLDRRPLLSELFSVYQDNAGTGGASERINERNRIDVDMDRPWRFGSELEFTKVHLPFCLAGGHSPAWMIIPFYAHAPQLNQPGFSKPRPRQRQFMRCMFDPSGLSVKAVEDYRSPRRFAHIKALGNSARSALFFLLR